jgi:hypothetical protein
MKWPDFLVRLVRVSSVGRLGRQPLLEIAQSLELCLGEIDEAERRFGLTPEEHREQGEGWPAIGRRDDEVDRTAGADGPARTVVRCEHAEANDHPIHPVPHMREER